MQFALGVLGSLVAAALFPALIEVVNSLLVRLLGWFPVRRRVNISGAWRSTWHVKSTRFPPQVTDEHTSVKQLGSRFYARFKADKMEFSARGEIDGDRYVTGTWHDRTKGGYHGAFQLIIDPKSREMAGVWIGFSAAGTVKSGRWEWTRP